MPSTMMNRLRTLLLAAVASAFVAACGFHLRGAVEMPFATMALRGQGGPMLSDLRHAIEAAGGTRLTTNPQAAEAVFTLLQESTSQSPMSYNADGTVALYQLVETVRYQLTDRRGAFLIAPTTLSQSSNLSYSTGAALAKANEADLLYRGMRADLIQRIMFQLAALHPAAAPAAPPAPAH